MIAQSSNPNSAYIVGALIAAGGFVLGGLVDVLARSRERKAERKDRRRERFQADLRIVQEATEEAYAATGSSLGPRPTRDVEEASNLVLAANLRGESATARIGDDQLTTTFKTFTGAIVAVVMGDRSDQLLEMTSASSAALHQRIGELYRKSDKNP